MGNIEQIARWYDEYAKTGKDYGSMPGILRKDGVPFFGLSFRRDSIQAPDHTVLARIMLAGDAPVIGLDLPTSITVRRLRQIQSVIDGRGGHAVYLPWNVISAAGIREKSIRLIANRKRTHAFRAPQQLIRAKVRPGWPFRGGDRTAYFLSGYDLNERGLSYFFCELPPGVEPTTVEEAYEALKPESVKMAERERIRVLRQGDIFAIRQRNFKPQSKPELWGEILGTNHVGQLVVRQDGLTYAHGLLRHAPSGRRRDHKNLPLRGGWYLCVKNTVPVTADFARSTRF